MLFESLGPSTSGAFRRSRFSHCSRGGEIFYTPPLPGVQRRKRSEKEWMKILDGSRLFPADGEARSVAARLYETVKDLPLISPHGHPDPRWFPFNGPFPTPTPLPTHPAH